MQLFLRTCLSFYSFTTTYDLDDDERILLIMLKLEFVRDESIWKWVDRVQLSEFSTAMSVTSD
jgi:hypothetical protein